LRSWRREELVVQYTELAMSDEQPPLMPNLNMKLPSCFTASVAKHRRITNHARKRYHERTGDTGADDRAIIDRSIDDPRAVWEELDTCMLLVTFL
jgi:hypothetical protein